MDKLIKKALIPYKLGNESLVIERELHGIHSSEMSPIVANAFLKGYKSNDFLSKNDLERLKSLIWLSGCINWNFVQRTIDILETNNKNTLKKHIDTYKLRGEKLLSLISAN